MSKQVEIHNDQIVRVPLNMIDLDPEQPRRHFDETKLKQLADDIKARDVREPIKLRAGENGRFILVKGERRYRASKLAKKKDIPAVQEEDKSDVDRLLNQVKENYLREDLNPIELAGFLAKLRDDHKIKVSDMPAFLKKHNLPEMSRAYISNMIRLVELPEWATSLITDGTLTAAHGKHLLAAKASEQVMAALEERVKERLELDEGFTTADMQEMVADGFHEHHIAMREHSAPFDMKKECKGCKTRKTVTNEWGTEITFCLNKECYDNKKTAAQEREKQEARNNPSGPAEPHSTMTHSEPLEVKPDADGVVDLDKHEGQVYHEDDFAVLGKQRLFGVGGIHYFDPAGCEGCQHNHLTKGEEVMVALDLDPDEDELSEPVRCCFNLACYSEKYEQQRESIQVKGRHKQYLADWCRKRIIGYHLQDDTALQLNVVCFMALGYPLLESDTLEEDVFFGVASVAQLANELSMTSLGACFDRGVSSHLAEIAAAGIREAGYDSVLMLASRIGLKLEDGYQIDQAYLELFKKEELVAMGEAWGIHELTTPGAWDTACKGKAVDLYPFFLREEAVEKIGVPEQLATLFKEVVG